ncbi:MAG: DUF177 domain-containing protein [Hyphomicrobiaceae bacterium]|nr:DUF177 domain-containing protein [Hyphomicrobiaceae bacterium]
MAAELDWVHSVGEVPESGLQGERRATPAQRAAVASALDLIACDRLEASYQLKPLAQGRYLLKGSLEAEVEQSCVVTLEPVASRISEAFEVELRPGLPGTASVAEFDALEARDIEPLEGGIIPLGQIVYEHLASAIDPYPRKEGVVLEQSAFRADTQAEASPFAVLKQLKAKK